MREEDSSLSRNRRMDTLCDAFEAAWMRNEKPSLTDFLAKGKGLDQTKLFTELAHTELEYLQKRGEVPVLKEYLVLFPEHAELVRRTFAEKGLHAPPTDAAASPDNTLSTSGELPSANVSPNDLTQDIGSAEDVDAETADLPERYGRYRIERLLGKGSFGQVALAYDEELERHVALKVPRRDRISTPKDLETYIAEARVVANLNHANLVSVYNIERSDDGLCFVVSEYIQGNDLQKHVKQQRLSHYQAAEIVAAIADALDYAHTQKVYHRDVKPGNILLSEEGTAHLADFGLAIKEEDWGRGAKMVGTPNYMSPEQARGEGHRVDARSDIFSLGVVMYELLTGRIPWRSKRTTDLLTEIAETEAPPLRHYVRDIHPELERICLKSLALKIRDRYSTAGEFAEDIRECVEEFGDELGDTVDSSGRRSGSQSGFRSRRASSSRRRSGRRSRSGKSSARAGSTRQGSGTSGSTVADDEIPVPIVPKGLRFFDEHDADFFLRLLPGPRDRYDLPDSIRFWLNHIERGEAASSCPVGLIYGPSGCGKSSFVRAGLIPELDPSVVPIVVEASGKGLEQNLVEKIVARCTGLADNVSLPETIEGIRRGKGLHPGSKLLIVIDQFEQWLNAHTQATPGQLHYALRQCDGPRVQCLILARTEYTIGIHRFMKQLDLTIEEGRNAMVVDVFDKIHATYVLKEIGRAYGRLEVEDDQLTSEHQDFLDNVIDELSENDKVSPIQISVFADMMKGKEWTAQSLSAVGGAREVGRSFLEETFESETAPLARRIHLLAAQTLLMHLLPDSKLEIKGAKRSIDELRAASGYGAKPESFKELIGVLDADLRLITPTDSDEGVPQYQLTHDYLVPSLRAWLHQNKRQSKQGRAELLLEELSSLWNEKPRNAHLPTLTEYVKIQVHTRATSWTRGQKQLMNKARRYYRKRIGIGAVIAAAVLVVCCVFWSQWKGAALVAELMQHEEFVDVQRTVRDLDGLLFFNAEGELERVLDSPNILPRPKLNVQVALTQLGGDGSAFVDDIAQYACESTQPSDMEDLTALLAVTPSLASGVTDSAIERLRAKDDLTPLSRLRAASLLGFLSPEQWDEELRSWVAQTLLSLSPLHSRDWLENGLNEVVGLLVDPLLASYRDPHIGTSKRIKCCELVTRATDAAYESPTQIARLVLEVRSVDEELGIVLGADAFKAEVAKQEAFQYWIQQSTELRNELVAMRIEIRKKQQEMAELQWQLRADANAEEADIKAVDEAQAAMLGRLKKQRSECRALDERIEGLADAISKLAVAMLHFGNSEHVWELLAHDEPRLVCLVIHRIPELPVAITTVIDELNRLPIDKDDPKDIAKRQGVLQCLAEYVDVSDGLTAEQIQTLIKLATPIYKNDPDPGVHGSAGMLLRRLDADLPTFNFVTAAEAVPSSPERLRWWQNSFGHIMVVIPFDDGGFWMGSPYSEVGRNNGDGPAVDQYEGWHHRKIPRSYAISSAEVTIQHYQAYAEFKKPDKRYAYDDEIAPRVECPAHMLTWRDAANYCNWLSEVEGMPNDQWCYQVEGNFVRQRPDHLKLQGYRLPTEAEWEYACRAGTSTSRYFGESTLLIEKHAWHLNNSEGRSRPVRMLKPNRWGLFDMLGNAIEWCDNAPEFRDGVDDYDHDVILGETQRPLRGGSYDHGFFTQLRSAAVDQSEAQYRARPIGFRVAKTLFLHEDED